MIRRVIALFAASFISFPAIADPATEEADLRRHIDILASDDFQGRRPGTVGEALAAHYIAQQFAAAGLEPAYADGFYQPVPLVERSAFRVSAQWRAGEAHGTWSDADFLAFGRTNEETLAGLPLVFLGYADDIGEAGSLADADLSGAAVLILTVDNPSRPDGPSFRERQRFLAERGARAVIGIVGEDTPWESIEAIFRGGRTELAARPMAPVEAVLSATAADALLLAAGFDPGQLGEAAAAPGFRPIPLDARIDAEVVTAVRPYDGFNVAARLAGGGATGEAVLFMAHYDHFGICRPEGVIDRICNGAVDNASGTAAIIEIARALAQGARPARDILFVATTAEEMGLLGAYAFAADPAVPLPSVVAALNLDTIAIAPAGAPVGIVGRGLTPLDPLVDEVAAELGRAVDSGIWMNAFVRRQDGWALLSEGVPAIMAGGSFTDWDLLNGFLDGPYHGPDDDIDEPLELGGAVEDVRLHVALGRAFADPTRYPTPRR